MLNKKIKLLYLSCHSIAEYDEVRLFKEMGIDVWSHGAYADPNNPGDKKRPGIKGKCDEDWVKMCQQHDKDHLPREMVAPFDVILSHWMPRWIMNNWETMKDKHVILRTNGQSSEDDERRLEPYRKDGLHIIRYSPQEKYVPHYVGHDAIIRFYKDPKIWKDWNGRKERVITVCQNMKRRKAFCNYDLFKAATLGFDRKLYGPDNEPSGKLWGGLLSYENLKRAYQDNRVYFYTGTKPACYTLNLMEAMMTGIPIVAIGGEHGNPEYLPEQFTYEIPFMITDKVNGFVANDIGLLHQRVEELMFDRQLAKRIGSAGRQLAIDLWGKEKIKKQWEEYFNSIKI